MITVTYQSRDFSKIEKYLLTNSPAIVSVKDIEDNTSIPVESILEYQDVKEDGEVNEILAIMTPDRKVYACQSQTFKRSLKEIAELYEGEQFTIKKTSGTSKGGRPYINCILDVEAMENEG